MLFEILKLGTKILGNDHHHHHIIIIIIIIIITIIIIMIIITITIIVIIILIIIMIIINQSINQSLFKNTKSYHKNALPRSRVKHYKRIN